MATIQLRKNLLNTKNVLQKKMQKTIFSMKWLELVGQKPFIYYTCPVKTHRKLKYTVLFQLHSIIKVLCEQTRKLTYDFLDYV